MGEKLFPCDISEIASCEADITFFAERHHPDTRKWFFDDFYRWFENPGESRAYVLLGDAGVGKSVMAGVLAQKSAAERKLAAAYFCRHKDDTRNNPRYLLGTIACQLCKCNAQYSNFVGGEGGISKFLGNSEIGIQGLFTKLLQEPLAKSNASCERMLIVIDALDETKYESRDDFLDLIMHRFPLLPQWLVFFITSRPEDTVQVRLKEYNPCIKICAGNSENLKFYQQHELDIRLYLEKSVDFSRLPCSAEDVAKKCNGLFLFAYYIERVLKDQLCSGKISQLTDLFPGGIGEFFRQNFRRIFDKVGADLYKKLFGCAIAAPTPLPISFISYILERENSDLDDQEVIDAFSTFLVVRDSDQTFAFLHGLIPSWLTDKKKASGRLFVDRNKEGRYLRDIISEVLSAAIANQPGECPPSMERDVLEYCDQIGVRLLCDYCDNDSLKVVFSYLANYQVIARRLKKKCIEIYSIIGDVKCAMGRGGFTTKKKEILKEIHLFLESNVHVLLQSPHLLHCCLQEASKTVQENLVFPDSIGATKIEHSWVPFGANEIPKEIVCFALSPDKKLIAGASEKSLYLFDACTLEQVQGPFAVTEMRDSVYCLEFSSDDFLFGMLDKWFSVKEGCVKKIFQFAFTSRKVCRRRRSFLKNSLGSHPSNKIHTGFCLVNIFCSWATYELRQRHKVCRDLVSFFHRERQALPGIQVLHDLLHSNGTHNKFLGKLQDEFDFDTVRNVSLCQTCFEFGQGNKKKTYGFVRQLVLNLYYQIFKFQVWNLGSGSPELEEAFFKHGDHFFLYRVSVAVLYGVQFLPKQHMERLFFAIAHDEFKLRKACKTGKRVIIAHPCYVIYDVEHCAFLEDSNALLYYTNTQSLHIINLETGIKLSSVTGRSPFFHTSKKQTVYWFVELNSETLNFLRDVPKDLRQFLSLLTLEEVVTATFVSAATVFALLPEFYKTVGEEDIGPSVPVKSVVFSRSGALIACHLGPKLYVCKIFGAFPYLLCEDRCECDSCHLTFSPDSTLLLHYIQNSNDDPRFQVWDVHSRTLLVTFDFPFVESLLPPLDCCCLSSDKTKLIVCGGFVIEIWEYDASACRLITRIENPVFISKYSRFTHCTVSPETNLLASCLVDRIALCSINTPTDQSIRLLPPAHLGKIEFCQFVKGGRYLISYGVDGNVFLWDLDKCEAIAFAKLCQGRESIKSLCRSCKADKFFFLTSSGRFGVLILCGLEHSILPKLPTLEVQSGEMMFEESCGQQKEQHGPTLPTHATDDLNVDEVLEEMYSMCDSEGNSVDSDECDDMEMLG